MGRVYRSATVGNIRVLELYPVLVNHHCGRSGARVLAMGDNVGHQLAENTSAQADGGGPFHIERIVEVLFDKTHEQIKSVYQVGAHGQAIIVAVRIAPSQEGVELVAGRDALDDLVRAEHQRRCKGVAGLSGEHILAHEPGDLQQFLRSEVSPRMLGRASPHQATGLLEEIGPQVGHIQMGKDSLFGKETELAIHEPGYLIQVADPIISILAAKINVAVGTMYLGACRDLNLDDPPPADFLRVWKEQVWRIQFVRIVGQTGDLGLHPVHDITGNPNHGPVIGHTQNDKPAIEI